VRGALEYCHHADALNMTNKQGKQLVQGRAEVHENKFVTTNLSSVSKLPMVLALAAKGIECFDCPFYATSNVDLPPFFDCFALFDHYINYGQFEGRVFRCDSSVYRVLHFSRQVHNKRRHLTRADVSMGVSRCERVTLYIDKKSRRYKNRRRGWQAIAIHYMLPSRCRRSFLGSAQGSLLLGGRSTM
jgi:hypothetical protein